MKRFHSFFLVSILTVMMLVTACSQPAQTGQTGQSGQTGKSTEYLLATGGTGGTYYPLGGAIANVWNESVDGLNVTVQSTGASVENMRLLGSKETELAISINSIAEDAFQGRDKFTEPIQNIRAIGVVYPEVVQIVTPKNSSIQSIRDLKGKRVSIGPAGSGTAVAAEQILIAFGMSQGDFQSFQDTFTDAADKLKDGNLDAAFAILSVPAANIEDIATSKEVRILPVEGPELAELMSKHPFYTPYQIPDKTYKGQDQAVSTVTMQAVMYAREDLPEEIVYQLTKTLYEKQPEIAKGYAIGSQIDLQKALDGVTVPLHPGAEKFYKEKGMK
ncbi:TAXI family TRAP transporter solute-binding subunit [Brevibacillus ruminantium]|uniref:TAXI family TRAP transporter solute-binding subunit n=1 Tax=Brevibacillus ruminantium TaxID=2950604 RepID=A0ABY4WQR7_9BACL|nr:TAXI family TRAP transporter solute-binding subunit [Brevibacillus ruminantium]USG66956.1 TAXI family TRAP transporter solute-binding subunit [Brevibacillus ruminantium]